MTAQDTGGNDSSTLLYEHPLNERMRTLLRLEHLLQRTEHHLQGDSPWDSRAAVQGLLDLLAVTSRADLRTDILKELDRQAGTLAQWRQSPHVDAAALDAVLQRLDATIGHLKTAPAPADALLRLDLLSAINQRSSIPAGNCSFDVPAYHHWLQRTAEARRSNLLEWLSAFEPLQTAVAALLDLTRQAGPFRHCRTDKGLYQEIPDAGTPCQLVRIALPSTADHFPEVSGGKHRFTVRFMQLSHVAGRPVPVDEEVTFELASCQI